MIYALKAEVDNLKIRATASQTKSGFKSFRAGGSFTSGGEMLKTWVVRTRKDHFVVRCGKVNDFGFTEVRNMDNFSTLAEAEKKSDLANYIFKKGAEMAVARG